MFIPERYCCEIDLFSLIRYMPIRVFIHTFVGKLVAPLPVAGFKPSKDVNYHTPDDTKSGKCLKNYFEDTCILLIIVYHFLF